MIRNKEVIFAPPWLLYPYLKQDSLGWRMGYGEGYIDDFLAWFSSLPLESKEEYIELFPEPFDWVGWYEKDYEGLIAKRLVQPQFTKNDIICSSPSLESNQVIAFWGHRQSKSGCISKSCFSQWWMSEFYYSSSKFICSEQFMMAMKARIFNDHDNYQLIMQSSDPNEMKSIGRKVANYNQAIWDEMKYDIVFRANYEKFIQNENIKEYLLSTEDKVIIEASPVDKVWGVGLAESDERILKPELWLGENILGFAIMHVRNEIRKVCKNQKLIDFDELHAYYD